MISLGTASVVFAPLIGWPVLIAAAVVALLLVALALWRGLSGWWLRALALAAVLAALANPALQEEERQNLTDIVIAVVDDSASDTPVKKPRARKAAGDAPAVAVPAGKRIKVATSKVVETELKEIKAAKTRTRKAAEAAPAPRVMKRTVKAKPE